MISVRWIWQAGWTRFWPDHNPGDWPLIGTLEQHFGLTGKVC